MKDKQVLGVTYAVWKRPYLIPIICVRARNLLEVAGGEGNWTVENQNSCLSGTNCRFDYKFFHCLEVHVIRLMNMNLEGTL